MSQIGSEAISDPLEESPPAERVNYATGQMLDVSDFQDEQTYHRAQLARLTKNLIGHGTVSGLRVTPPEADDGEWELRVEPGLAADRYGRLIAVSVPQCIRLTHWFDDQETEALLAAVHSAPVAPSGDAVVADLFMSAHSCGRGKTPAFATGPFDALDAVVSSRLEERSQLELVLRKEASPIPEPGNFWPSTGLTRDKMLQAVLGSWDDGSAFSDLNGLEPLQEHVAGHDPSAIFLARVILPIDLPVAPETRPRTKLSERVTVDNSLRPFIFLPGKWFGRAPDVDPLVQP